MKKTALAANIKRIREELGLSQKELAARAGVEPATISRYESGSRQPQGALLEQVAAALGVEPATLDAEPVSPVLAPDLVARMAELEAQIERVKSLIVAGGDSDASEVSGTFGGFTDEAGGRTLPLGRAVHLAGGALDVLAAQLERGTTMRDGASVVVESVEGLPFTEPGQVGWLLDPHGRGRDGECVVAWHKGLATVGWLAWRAGHLWLDQLGGGTVPSSQIRIVAVVVSPLVPYRRPARQTPMVPARLGGGVMAGRGR